MDSAPSLPVPLKQLPKYISGSPDKPVNELLQPYRQYEAHLRGVFAQDRQNPALDDPHINVVPLFTDDTSLITTRARDLTAESEEEKSKYVMALPDEKRRPNGSPATVDSIGEFQKNFAVFSESSLSELDWSNVVAAGSSVVNCLLPVPAEFNVNKRKLREYYHQKFCPASDVDLFLYGLTHEQAIEKIKSIEQSIRDSILSEVTVVRTKYAITIASQYPVRHVQIVLRVYKSISEILTGFDIDAAGGAYDGKQVYVTPRALGSFITQVNHVDLSRRSPSYENRLSKYSHRNFEVYWPELDRSRVDPTIFERSFQRTLGLARLLVLERLPTSSVRETYQNKRRKERGRPELFRQNFRLFGNIKGNHEDEISDWLSEEDVSSYHTFTVPYGEKFHAKRIEKLCYTRDLLLNAEWNQPKERKVYLHRHPAFFGRVQDVIEDCCGCCPEAVTPEEVEVAEKEAEIYISGKVSFMIDDPGRQQIGSFNPLTEQDWTDMAYVGNTARLCQSIVDGDVDDVLNWLSQEGADPNKRDYTGRTPLHLAVMASTVDVVKCLVDHGARLTARLADGKTALHLAASRGNAEMVKILMEKSITNEEEEIERQERKRKTDKLPKGDVATPPEGTNSAAAEDPATDDDSDEADGSDGSDGELVEASGTETDGVSLVTGSFVKVKSATNEDGELVPEEADDEPDYYQIDVLAWDVPCSPLHLAISGGHENVVEALCDYGADSILPVKFLNSENYAILTLVLALALPRESAKSMAQLLLRLGAMCSQADGTGYTVFHKYVKAGSRYMVDLLLNFDKAGVKAAINHIVITGNTWDPSSLSPLQSAIELGDPVMVLKLLDNGAKAEIDFDTWLKAAQTSSMVQRDLKDYDKTKKNYKRSVQQPLLAAIRAAQSEVVLRIIDGGANVNILTSQSEHALQTPYMRNYTKCQSALDLVRSIIEELRKPDERWSKTKPTLAPGMDDALSGISPGTYRHWIVSHDIECSRKRFKQALKVYEEGVAAENKSGALEKEEAIADAISELEVIEKLLLKNGAKTFKELHPDIEFSYADYGRYRDHADPQRPYKHEARFSGDSSMNERRRGAYIDLMEAAWVGDVDKIKSLTLQAWGEDQDQPPLIAAIRDGDKNSPFSLAFLRGHVEASKAILDIVDAQWSPEDKDEVRYKIQGDDDDDAAYSDSYDSENDYDDSEAEVRVVTEKLDKKFTIENVGQVPMQVKCHTKPAAVLQQAAKTFTVEKDGTVTTGDDKTLLAFTIDKDDLNGLKVLLDMAQNLCQNAKPDPEDEHAKNYTFPADIFITAVEDGKVQAIRYIIKRTGAGMPLDHLVKKSGVKMESKPRFYQGLTVYGKKRKDWATAGRNMVVRTAGIRTPPLLHAAMGSQVDSVEFFLSDTPHRLYNEFAKTKQAREDPRVQHIMASPGGFDRVVSKWLGGDNEMVMHCAVTASPGPNANEVLEYLIEACPGSLEKKTPNGDTPLMVACKLGRADFVKILIAAGADQATRNSKGENIVHAALGRATQACRLRRLLNLLDPDLRKHLFLQRKNIGEDGTTPLHAWIQDKTRNHNDLPRPKTVVAMLKLVLEYSNGEELEMLNGAGDTCLHTGVVGDAMSVIKTLVDFKPQLLYRENAVGRTPAEVAHDKLTAEIFAKPYHNYYQAIDYPGDVTDIHREPDETFIMAKSSSDEVPASKANEIRALVGLSGTYSSGEFADILATVGLSNPKNSECGHLGDNKLMGSVIWDYCSTVMSRHSGKRRLVSLNEANDVARRLGESHQASRYFSVNGRRDEDEEDDEEKADGENEDKDKAEAVDFATRAIAQAGSWLLPAREEGKEDQVPKCALCDVRHTEDE